ncbi:ATP-dependent RNA helicase HrpA [Propionibacteriaceae bacterium G57]|uniref:ATP-dependent RNA helicase HrpA n=1 Tax=Aestuariimicrobium sp. G57 TaxID=3418485 RepID=UPI003DA710BA
MTTPTDTAGAPTITFDEALPISAHVDEIADLLRRHQVVVVAGETGSGKTTQLPKIALALGRDRIAHTQPRRIAARTVAERIAHELGVGLGEQVGYRVRFTRKTSSDTQLTVMTDGVLLAEITHDRDLRRYDTIIIDEAHERSLNIDFLLGYLKQLLPRRRDLKVVITSATIDTARFSEHFNNAPIVEVSGRTYPVEVRYQPLDEQGDQNQAIVAAVGQLMAAGPGDVLVFLSGEREIRDAAEALGDARLADVEVLPLYARLSAAEQNRIFVPHPHRRIVLATNVAETSLTVPGIRYVVDVGTARISRYSARTKVQRLPIETVSQASANQRAGRCGRVAPGICIRLYSEEDFASRPEFTEPEILRTNLASVILQMAQAKLGAIADFPFVEAPDGAQVSDGIKLLEELGALKPGHRNNPRLTGTGHQLARIPVDPRLARMLVEAQRRDALREVHIIVAALAIPDVRERPSDKREQADALHARFTTDATPRQEAPDTDAEGKPLRHTAHTGTRKDAPTPHPAEGGDIMALVRLWNYLEDRRANLSGNAFRRLCRDEFINFLRVREWEDLAAQLRQISRDLDWRPNRTPAPISHVLTAVASGLLSHVGLLDVREAKQPSGTKGARRRPGPREYIGARGARFAINPGSALARVNPPLVMAVELVETTRLWARMVAPVEAGWIEEVGAHALKKQHSEPHWSSSSASVVAYEKVSLYGVPIIAERRVDYAGIDPVAARQIFIRQGLVEGGWATRHGFFAHNATVRDEAEALEERTRRRDLVVDDQSIFDFYDRRIPAEVVSGSTFDRWWRRIEQPHLLDMTMADVIRDDADGPDAGSFPDHWPVNGLVLPVTYVFDPGSGHDGVTVTVPLTQVNQLTPEPFSWQVPGLRAELAAELIRGLPKAVRRAFVPAPDHARAALRWLEDEAVENQLPLHTDERFADELARALRAITGEVVAPDDWHPEDVPSHLQVSFQVSGEGAPKQPSKDIAELRQLLAGKVSQVLTRASRRQAVTGATAWTFDEVPTRREITRGQTTAVGYPALTDEGNSVGVVVLDSPQAAADSHARGVRRLLVLTNPDPTNWVVSHLPNTEKIALAHSPYASVPALLADARLKAVDALARASDPDLTRTRSAAAYDQLALEVRQGQADRMRQVVSAAAQVLTQRLDVVQLLAGMPPGAAITDDVRQQLDNLVFTNFISATPDPWYGHLPRYVQAMAHRLRAWRANPARDAQQQQVVDELEADYAHLCEAQPPGRLPDAVEEVAFLLEELRVSLFAQQLRTAVPVSAKRVRTAMAKLR